MTYIVIQAGTTWAYSFPVQDLDGDNIDLTEWNGRAQVRTNKWVRESPVLHEWTTAGDNPNATLLNSALILNVDPEESSEWTWRYGAYAVELIDPDGRVARIDEGEIEVSPEVTA